jgi:hypothetical protein
MIDVVGIQGDPQDMQELLAAGGQSSLCVRRLTLHSAPSTRAQGPPAYDRTELAAGLALPDEFEMLVMAAM